MTKVVPEEKYRANMMSIARELGVEVELKRTFDKYDALLAKAQNSAERQAIQVAGCEAVLYLLHQNPGQMQVGGFLYKGQQIGGTVIGREDPAELKNAEMKKE